MTDIDYEALIREMQEQIEWDRQYWFGDSDELCNRRIRVDWEEGA